MPHQAYVKLHKQKCRILLKKEILLPFTQEYCHLRKTGKKGIEKNAKVYYNKFR